MLDPPSAVAIVNGLRPYVNESIRIGMLNCIDSRVPSETEQEAAMIRWLGEHQTDAWVMAVVNSLKSDPLKYPNGPHPRRSGCVVRCGHGTRSCKSARCPAAGDAGGG
jgi:hypothetical protein